MGWPLILLLGLGAAVTVALSSKSDDDEEQDLPLKQVPYLPPTCQFELLDGAVGINLDITEDKDTQDYVVFIFRKQGKYEVSFEVEAGKQYKSCGKIPESFVIELNESQMEHVIEEQFFSEHALVTVKLHNQQEVVKLTEGRMP